MIFFLLWCCADVCMAFHMYISTRGLKSTVFFVFVEVGRAAANQENVGFRENEKFLGFREMHSMHWSVMGHSVHPIMHQVSLYLDATQHQLLLIFFFSFTQPFAPSPFSQQTMADGCVL